MERSSSWAMAAIRKAVAAALVSATCSVLAPGEARASVSTEQLLAIIQEQGALIRQQSDKIEKLEKRLDRVEGSIKAAPPSPTPPPRVSTLTAAAPPAADDQANREP